MTRPSREAWKWVLYWAVTLRADKRAKPANFVVDFWNVIMVETFIAWCQDIAKCDYSRKHVLLSPPLILKPVQLPTHSYSEVWGVNRHSALINSLSYRPSYPSCHPQISLFVRFQDLPPQIVKHIALSFDSLVRHVAFDSQWAYTWMNQVLNNPTHGTQKS